MADRFKALREELSKTAVLSDYFKDVILALASSDAEAEDDTASADSPPSLKEIALSKRFVDKAAVLLKSYNLEELFKKLSDRQITSLCLFFSKNFPIQARHLLLGTEGAHDIFLEIILREINEHPAAVRDVLDGRF
jgi:hypothetical protein